MHAERDWDILKMEKESVFRQAQIQKKHMNDRIQFLNAQVFYEKDTKDKLLDRYEESQKQNVSA